MAWEKLGSTTLTSSNANNDTPNFTSTKFTQMINHTVGMSGGENPAIRVGNSTIDTSSNYSTRQSDNGVADGSSINQNAMYHNTSSISTTFLLVEYCINISSQEKLFIHFWVNQNTAGAGTAPKRQEGVGKWVNTSNQFDIMRVLTGSATQGVDSNITALGSDAVSSWTLQDGLIFYETDTNKEYILSNNTWTEL